MLAEILHNLYLNILYRELVPQVKVIHIKETKPTRVSLKAQNIIGRA